MGSNPTLSSIFPRMGCPMGAVDAPAKRRAEFDSPALHHSFYAGLAQLVEHRFCNSGVGSSSLATGHHCTNMSIIVPVAPLRSCLTAIGKRQDPGANPGASTMNGEMKHRHHIIPRHMGGLNIPSNIVELTPDEHAQAHQALYERYGKIEDYLAWRGLAGLQTRGEIFSSFGKLGIKARATTNTGKKYRSYPRKTGSTRGLMWFHNPNDPTQKRCVKTPTDAPDGWVRGQGRKAKNPGLNFTSKLRSRRGRN